MSLLELLKLVRGLGADRGFHTFEVETITIGRTLLLFDIMMLHSDSGLPGYNLCPIGRVVRLLPHGLRLGRLEQRLEIHIILISLLLVIYFVVVVQSEIGNVKRRLAVASLIIVIVDVLCLSSRFI